MRFQTSLFRGKARRRERGASLLELAILLPLLAVMAFGVIDLGRLIHARLVVTNVCREGGSLGSRDILQGQQLISMLQSSATPLNLQADGRIFITKIKSGLSERNPQPYIDSLNSFSGGSYPVSSNIGTTTGQGVTGLSATLLNHLRFEGAPQNTSDIAEITVVEVFYHYRPITPLPGFVQNNLFPAGPDGVRGILISSRAIF